MAGRHKVRARDFLISGAALTAAAVGGWYALTHRAVSEGPSRVTVIKGPAAPFVTRATPVPIATKTASVSDEMARTAAWSRISTEILPLLNRTGEEGRGLNARLVGEHRDEPWATKAERDVRAVYNRIESIGEAGRPFDIRCGSTICQVTGDLEDRPGSRGGEAMVAVQAPSLIATMAAQGFRFETSVFGRGADKREIFVTHYTRAKPEVIAY